MNQKNPLFLLQPSYTLRNSTMRQQPSSGMRNAPPFYHKENAGNAHVDLNSSLNHSLSNERSFSSFFDVSSINSNNSHFNKKNSDNVSKCSGSSYSTCDNSFRFNMSVSEHNSSDDDGIYLQISNLDQWYDETSLRNYLMNQLKPITPILSLTIETPSIAKVKVPSIQVI
jgi:meiosis arrest female protein 1